MNTYLAIVLSSFALKTLVGLKANKIMQKLVLLFVSFLVFIISLTFPVMSNSLGQFLTLIMVEVCVYFIYVRPLALNMLMIIPFFVLTLIVSLVLFLHFPKEDEVFSSIRSPWNNYSVEVWNQAIGGTGGYWNKTYIVKNILFWTVREPIKPGIGRAYSKSEVDAFLNRTEWIDRN